MWLWLFNFARYRNRLDSVYAGGRGCSEWYIRLYSTKGRYRSSCVSKRYFLLNFAYEVIGFTKHCVSYIILTGGVSSRAFYFKTCILVFSSIIALETSTIHTPKVPCLQTLRPMLAEYREKRNEYCVLFNVMGDSKWLCMFVLQISCWVCVYIHGALLHNRSWSEYTISSVHIHSVLYTHIGAGIQYIQKSSKGRPMKLWQLSRHNWVL